MRGLAASVEHTIMTNMSQKRNDLLYLPSISSSLWMKLTMGTPDIGSNLPSIKVYFVCWIN